MSLHSVVIQKLLTTNSHISKQTVAHHLKQFTYGIRNRQAILDSDKTLICLRNALNFITCLSRDPSSSILFINTNPIYQAIIDEMTLKVSSFNPERASHLWKMRGFMTNSFSPKKFRSRNKKLVFGPTKLPDCVVVFDSERKSSIFLEAERMGIPIVGLVDSSMPWEYYKKVTYPIPANDSVQFVYLVCNMITKCLMLEKKKQREKKFGAKATDREEVKQIEEGISEGKVDIVNEVLVMPYGNLAPLSSDIAETKEILDKLVVVRFSGALGENMGFRGPKSLIEVKDGATSLDLAVEQIKSLNSKYGCNIPLILIHSIKTHDDILKVLDKYSRSEIDIHVLTQGEQTQEDLYSSEEGEGDRHSFDHGAQFLSLMNGGTLDVLFSLEDKEYALVVNPDDVGAIVDPKILNHLTQNSIEHCLEVTPTTSTGVMNFMATSLQGKFKLEDFTSDPTEFSEKKFKFIDTRNLWIDLKAIKRLVDNNALKASGLSTSKSLRQLCERTIAITVPQSRFLPLNSTSDLLLVQSDLYKSNNGVLVRNDYRTIPTDPVIELGPEFEKVSDFQSRFKTIPSIIRLDSLEVTGNVRFGADVTLKGKVTIAADPGVELEIPDGVVLEDEEINGPEDL